MQRKWFSILSLIAVLTLVAPATGAQAPAFQVQEPSFTPDLPQSRSVGAEPSQVSVKYTFQKPVVERAVGYDGVAVPDLHNPGAPGAPALPFETVKIGAGLTNTLTGPQFQNVPLSVVQAVTVTRWVDPEGRQPITYEEWKGKIPVRGPFRARRILERRGDLVPPQTLPKVCVIVNSTLYGSIQTSVDQYASDLEAEGYTVIVYSTSGGTPSDLRIFLQGELPDNLVGCLLVGDLPVPWYEMDNDFYGYAEFPADLYYMDLDGQWTDADADGKFDDHTDGAGDVAPEIWVGRLTASPLSGDEVTRIRNYFSKNHQYRTGGLNLAHRALAYIYDDWSSFGVSDLDLMYGDNVTVMNEKGMTSAEDYRERLEETHRFVHVMAHSSPWGHSFSSGWVSSTEIEDIDPRTFFYNLFACSNARYVEHDYMGGYYIFAPTHGLAAVGSTKTGSMLSFEQFYGPLGEGKSLGEAYHEWFDYKAQGGFDLGEKQWHYGMTLLGDPTLTVVDLEAPTASILSPVAHEHLYATATIVGTAADASFNNYTVEYGPGTRPVTWTQLISSSSPVTNGTLATWDTRAFSGTYTFRLTVNANGQDNEDRVTARVKNAEITSPVPNDILGPGSVSITGTAAITGFQNYVIEYGVGENPASWSSTGISLVGGGLSEVINGTLATMDTTLMGGINDYTIRLTVNGSGGLAYQDKVMVHVDPTLQAGWPQSVAYRIVAPCMAIGDIDGDGDLEVVAAEGKSDAYETKVYAWHHDGTMVHGWPQRTYGRKLSSPALADIDRDGDLEIIAGSTDDRVYAWHHDGIAVAGWPQMTGDVVHSSPTVGDIDGDGIMEIVVGSFDDQVYIWHYDGTAMNGWPQTAGNSVYSSPALGDLDGDGDMEIVVGTHGGTMYAWHHDGAIVSGWPVTIPVVHMFSSPALGDIDGDGDIETVVGADQVYAWHHDGTTVSGWPQPAGGWVGSSPALGDMDGDGDLEIIVGFNQVYAWHGDGTTVTGWPVALEFVTDSSPVLGDLDGDADMEVVIGSGDYDDHVYAWHHDGSGVADWPRVVPRFEGSGGLFGRLSSPILEDVDQDGDIEVTIGAESKVMMWDLAGAYDEANVEWKMFHHDLWHTGLYTSSMPNLPPFVRDVEASPGYVVPGNDVIIMAKVSDEDGVSSVTAEIESPNETVRGTITLYDDGAHDDGAAGDGTYGNTWTTLLTKLDYVVDITAVDGLSKSYTHDNAADFTTQDVAYVQYNAHTINYDSINHDGTANPGEYVQFSITLDNIGVLNAPGVTATISTADPHIWYYDSGAASFGDIAAGGTATCGSYDYYFRVENTCPHSHTVRFTLDIGDSSGNAWSDSFDVTIIDNVGPAISGADASPRYTVAGEPVAITAYYVEDGSGVSSVQAVIESPDETPIITVTLHDDGAHNDGEAGDGTYGNTWITDVTQRDYTVDFVTEDGLGNVRAYDNLALFTTKAFTKTTDILFVPDYGGNSTDWFQPYYTNALDALGYSYDIWDTMWRGAPDSATLNLYTDGVVIWAAPDWGYFGDWDVQPGIEAYLDAGGRLFMSGQDIGQDLNGTTLLSDYLHATWIQDRTYLYALNGAIGDPIGDGLALGISGGDGANNQYDTDEIDPISPAATVFTYDTGATTPLEEPLKPSQLRPQQGREPGAGPASRSWEEQENLASLAASVPSARARGEGSGALRGGSAEPSARGRGSERLYFPVPPERQPRLETEAEGEASPAGVISSGTAGLRVDTGTYRVVYFAFGFEAINRAADRAMVMGRVLNWLGAVPGVLSRNLSIQQSLVSGTPEPGATLTYRLAYANLGYFPASDVWITDTLPPGVIYVSSAGPVVPAVTGQTVVWDLGTLPGRLDLNAFGEISITARIPVTVPVGAWLDNQAQISTSDVETETTGSGLVGGYYQYDRDAIGIPPDDPFTNGVLKLRRTDPQVDFFWDSASPQPGVVYADCFAGRWTGYVYAPQSGTYTFATVTDDGARLWVNGSQLVDDWTQHGMETRSGQIELAAGQWYTVQFDFEEGNGGAGARLQWQLPGGAGLTAIPQWYLSPQAGFMNNRSDLGLLVMPPVKTSELLLVLDYGGYDTDWFRSYFTNTLDDLAYAYDVWDTELRGPPDADVLNQYTDGVVVWSAPYWGYVIYDSTFTALQSYLDAGGRLFLTSQDTGYYLDAWGNTGFLNGYLHAAHVQDDTDLYALNGTGGDPIGDGLALNISGGDGANNQYSTDEIDPISPAVTVFTYDTGATTALKEPLKPSQPRPQQGREPGAGPASRSWEEQENLAPFAASVPSARARGEGSGALRGDSAEPLPRGRGSERLYFPVPPERQPRLETEAEGEASPAGVISSGTAGLRVDTGTYRVVYFSFGFEGINSPEDRQTVMNRVVRWLGPWPTLSGLPNQVFTETTSLPGTIDLWAYASDAETPVSELTYTIEGTPPPGAGVSIVGNRWLTVNPSSSWCGYTDVTVRVTDPGGLWDNDTLRVAVAWSCQG